MSNGPTMEGPAFFVGLLFGAFVGAMICINIGVSMHSDSVKKIHKQAMELGHGQYETNSDGVTSWHWKGETK